MIKLEVSLIKSNWLLAATENPDEILSIYLLSFVSFDGLPCIEYKSSPILASASNKNFENTIFY